MKIEEILMSRFDVIPGFMFKGLFESNSALNKKMCSRFAELFEKSMGDDYFWFIKVDKSSQIQVDENHIVSPYIKILQDKIMEFDRNKERFLGKEFDKKQLEYRPHFFQTDYRHDPSVILTKAFIQYLEVPKSYQAIFNTSPAVNKIKVSPKEKYHEIKNKYDNYYDSINRNTRAVTDILKHILLNGCDECYSKYENIIEKYPDNAKKARIIQSLEIHNHLETFAYNFYHLREHKKEDKPINEAYSKHYLKKFIKKHLTDFKGLIGMECKRCKSFYDTYKEKL